MLIYIYIHIYIYIYICVCVYIHIYIERSRSRYMYIGRRSSRVSVDEELIDEGRLGQEVLDLLGGNVLALRKGSDQG